jgi:prevent-host-death family protein
MRRNVSIAEARDHLTGLLRDVERGKTVELTRRGKPIAVLISRDEYERLRGKGPSLLEALRAWQAECPPQFEGFTPEEIATLRDRSPGRDAGFR